MTLARWDDDDIDMYLSQDLARFTERTVTDVAQIRQRIAGIRAGEQIWTDGEYVEGLASVAAPVLDEIGQPVASLYAYGPSYRFPDRDTTSKGSAAWIAERVRAQAVALSKDLGWVEPICDEGAA